MPEQDPTQSRIDAIMERAGAAIGNGVENIRRSANTLKTVGKIAGLGVGVSLGLVGLASAEEPPVRTPDMPAAEAPVAYTGTTAEVSAQTCVNPNVKIKSPILSGPKKGYGDGTEYRTFRANVSYDAMPPGCERFKRYLEPILQTESPKKPGVWRRAGTSGPSRDDGAESYKKSEDILSIYPGYPECIDGPRKIRARVLFSSSLRSTETNKIVARKFFKKSVRVKAAC